MENIEISVNEKELTVDITISLFDKKLQVSGDLECFDSGRSKEYEFSPSWFSDDEAEEFYNEKWEEIEKQIQSKL